MSPFGAIYLQAQSHGLFRVVPVRRLTLPKLGDPAGPQMAVCLRAHADLQLEIWIPLRIDVQGRHASLYVNGVANPSLVDGLKTKI